MLNGRNTTQTVWTDRNEFKATARDWGQRLKVNPTSIRIQPMTRKWASCSPAGVVTFSSDLLEEPRPFGEAVILHELLHLQVRNHGKLFRSLMRSYLPDAESLLGGRVSCRFDASSSPHS